MKRRVRLLLSGSGLDQKYWPGVARYAGEERLRKQLATFGVPVQPLLPIGSRVTVKRKRWHRYGALASPFRTMTLMGPSPLMSTGYILMDEGQLQHARLAVKTDPNSDQAIMELLEVQAAGHPHRRLHGKQPPDPTLPDVPPPKQHSDGDFLSLAAHRSEGEEPGGAEAEIEDRGEPPQLEEGEDAQWPQGIFSHGEPSLIRCGLGGRTQTSPAL